MGNPTLQLHNWAYGVFFQDDYRATKNLTLNFGVRYEYSTVPQEANNLLGNFDPNVGMVQVGHQISSLYNPDHKNFGPRVGFAWDIERQWQDRAARRRRADLRNRELAVVRRLQQCLRTGQRSDRSAH